MNRPVSDVQMLGDAGFSQVTVDFRLSERIYREVDELYNPARMFALRCVK